MKNLTRPYIESVRVCAGPALGYLVPKARVPSFKKENQHCRPAADTHNVNKAACANHFEYTRASPCQHVETKPTRTILSRRHGTVRITPRKLKR